MPYYTPYCIGHGRAVLLTVLLLTWLRAVLHTMLCMKCVMTWQAVRSSEVRCGAGGLSY